MRVCFTFCQPSLDRYVETVGQVYVVKGRENLLIGTDKTKEC